ncbi:MAG: hypothetical protein ACO3NW_04965 [Kiritimatiellia bacterium]
MNKSNPIYKIAENIVGIQREFVTATLNAYGPEVDEIIRNGIQDKQRIECILDWLLEAAYDEKALVYFKKLCRHLYFIDEQGATFYVQSYREMWDEESLK